MIGSSRPWAALVAEGLQLAAQDSRNQWAWGDLALEVEPMGWQGGAPTGALERLYSFAEEIDVAARSLQEYRRVASAWPANTRRLGISFSVHQALAALSDRFELIASRDRWRVREARDIADERQQDGETPPTAPRATAASDPSARAGGAPSYADVARELRDELRDEPVIRRRVERRLLPLWSAS